MIKLRSIILESEEDELFRVGFDPDEESSETPIDWDKPDIQMWKPWDVPTIKEFLGLPSNFNCIYPSILDVNELDYNLAEEDPDIPEDERGGYDWDEYRVFARRGLPPIVVVRSQDGHISLADGNHRLKWATEVGYQTIGAWVVDKLLQAAVDKKK
jgi:hypothetical protein